MTRIARMIDSEVSALRLTEPEKAATSATITSLSLQDAFAVENLL